MNWTAAYVLLVAIGAVAYAVVFNVRRNARLRRFWDQPDTLVEWQRRYPARTVREITAFLTALNDAFAFDRKYVFRFGPDDHLFDIYRTAEPGGTPPRPETAWTDVHRFELNLKTAFGSAPPELWERDRTLATIFEHTSQSAAPEDPQAHPQPRSGDKK